MKFILSQGKFNVFLIFILLAISTSLVSKLTSTYEKDIVFKLVVKDLPNNLIINEIGFMKIPKNSIGARLPFVQNFN